MDGAPLLRSEPTPSGPSEVVSAAFGLNWRENYLHAIARPVLKVCCPWTFGQWRGAWSSDSDLWDRFPSINAELRREVSTICGASNGKKESVHR